MLVLSVYSDLQFICKRLRETHPLTPLAAVTSFMQPLREGLCNSEYSELCIKTRIAFFGNLYLEAWPLQLGHAHRLPSDFENRGILRNFCLRKPCLCWFGTEFRRTKMTSNQG